MQFSIFYNYMICEVYRYHSWRHGYPPSGFRIPGPGPLSSMLRMYRSLRLINSEFEGSSGHLEINWHFNGSKIVLWPDLSVCRLVGRSVCWSARWSVGLSCQNSLKWLKFSLLCSYRSTSLPFWLDAGYGPSSETWTRKLHWRGQFQFNELRFPQSGKCQPAYLFSQLYLERSYSLDYSVSRPFL